VRQDRPIRFDAPRETCWKTGDPRRGEIDMGARSKSAKEADWQQVRGP
jgi:hypothetical protein